MSDCLTISRSWLRRLALVVCTAWCSVALAQPIEAVAQRSNDNRSAKPADAAPRPPQKPSYYLASQVDWRPLLAPPPEVNSAEQQRDLQAVLAAQAMYRQGSARRELAIADTDSSCFRIAYVLSPTLTAEQVPKTALFLSKAANEGNDTAGVLKAYWHRPRPFVVSDRVERLGDIDPDFIKKNQQEQQTARRTTADNGSPVSAANKLNLEEQEKNRLTEQKRLLEYSSYPSGHSTYGTLCAIFLSAMVPEKQALLFKRATEYRQSRLIVGAHFPTDVEAGRIVATAAAAVMSQNFAFQRDLDAARSELRAALGLPAELSREPTAPHKLEP